MKKINFGKLIKEFSANKNKLNPQQLKVGILGVRGYVGKELVKLIEEHPLLTVGWLSSRQLKGQSVKSLTNSNSQLLIQSSTADEMRLVDTEIVVLALPNGLAQPYVEVLERNAKVELIIDLSADYRFDDNWFYSVPEINNIKQGKTLDKPIKISNPGCYATAMQLAIEPLKDLVEAKPNCFGVSGYSGAGTKPSNNNNPENLKNNIIAYKSIEHLHEKEVSYHLDTQVYFSPHVAEFFRGINMTIQLEFSQPQTHEKLMTRLKDYYAMHPLVTVLENIPTIQQVVNTPFCLVGGIQLSKDGKRATLIAVLDNLLKGAASQAIQNINLALGQKSALGLLALEEINPLVAQADLTKQPIGELT